jgi:hypothetical protein
MRGCGRARLQPCRKGPLQFAALAAEGPLCEGTGWKTLAEARSERNVTERRVTRCDCQLRACAISAGDRIGERMRSRLHEMCRIVTLDGADFRQKFRSASFR